MSRHNLAAGIARYFLDSKLTPALVIAIVTLGLLAIWQTPREENPQITMPAATIVTEYTGNSAAEVDRLVTQRGERVLAEVAGIEHVYTVSSQNLSLITVLFHVGDDPTKSFVDLYDHVNAHLDELPRGASQPRITPLAVDDIPIVVLTLHGKNYNRGELYAAAERLIDAIRPLDGVAAITTYGGLPRAVDVKLDPVRLGAYGLSPVAIARAIAATNVEAAAGALRSDAGEIPLHVGTPFTSARQTASQIVGVSGGAPVTLGEVASVAMGWVPEENQTRFGYGGAFATEAGATEPAVSIAIAKKPGSNAVAIADAVRARVASTEIPPGVAVTVTR
ncbi:MAG TPA: efflux RND transporter permease subunit, partial [Candidatus Tumulicola sp.]|nr:efflux RND transporter permease subunit [Candidatus Tumulicola sp.]